VFDIQLSGTKVLFEFFLDQLASAKHHSCVWCVSGNSTITNVLQHTVIMVWILAIIIFKFYLFNVSKQCVQPILLNKTDYEW